MLREAFGTIREMRAAQRAYEPPEDIVDPDDDNYVNVSVLVDDDIADTLRHVYNTTETNKPYQVGHIANHALMISGLSLVAGSRKLRLYLLDQEKRATELPTYMPPSAEYVEYRNRLRIKLERPMWSLATVMEEEMDIPIGAALRYGIAVMRTARANPDLELSLVDRRGKTGKITTNLRTDIDLSGPPEFA